MGAGHNDAGNRTVSRVTQPTEPYPYFEINTSNLLSHHDVEEIDGQTVRISQKRVLVPEV